MSSHFLVLVVTGLTIGMSIGLGACSESGQDPVTGSPALATTVPEGMVRGTVLKTMDSGGYTYVLLETDEGQRWLATAQTAVKVGDVLQTGQGAAMSNFESKTLNRTFDVIYFVGSVQNLSAPTRPEGTEGGALPEGHPAIELPEGHPSLGGDDETKNTTASVAEFEPGQNIAYMFANKDALLGQQISLRGTVVKYNEGIMGRNFIHIQDGSGDGAEGDNDLVVTSNDTTAVGETAVFTGTVILDKDFGAGYSFPVLMEDTRITTE